MCIYTVLYDDDGHVFLHNLASNELIYTLHFRVSCSCMCERVGAPNNRVLSNSLIPSQNCCFDVAVCSVARNWDTIPAFSLQIYTSLSVRVHSFATSTIFFISSIVSFDYYCHKLIYTCILIYIRCSIVLWYCEWYRKCVKASGHLCALYMHERCIQKQPHNIRGTRGKENIESLENVIQVVMLYDRMVYIQRSSNYAYIFS